MQKRQRSRSLKKRSPNIIDRFQLQRLLDLPPWGKWTFAGLAVGLSIRPAYRITASTTELLLKLFQLSHLNPGNVVGVGIGIIGAASISYAIVEGIRLLPWLIKQKKLLASLSFWGLSTAAVLGSGLGTLSLSVLLFPKISLKLAFVFSVFTAGLVTAALVESQQLAWDRVLRGQRLGRLARGLLSGNLGRRSLPWGKLWIKGSQEPLGYFILGAPGMGKSTWLEVLLSIALSGIGVIPHHRGLLYDAKPDQSAGLVPFLEAIGVPYKILNPLDRRCCGWLLGRDIYSEASAAEFAAVLIPESENQKDNKYFIDSARLLVTAVIVALIYAKGKRFTLRDILLACSSKADMAQLLKNYHPRYEAYLEFFKEKKGQKNEVLTTIQANLLPLNVIAARWEHAQEAISIRDWLRGEYVLVMGSDFEFPETLKRINQLMFRFITSALKGLPDDPNRRIWIEIDELASFGEPPQIEDILALGRSKSICTFLSTQNIPALMRILGREKTHEILGLCRWKAVMGVDPETARLLSEYFSDYEYVEFTDSASVSYGPQGSTSTYGTQERVGTRRTITAQELMDMNIPSPGPEHGLSAYFAGPEAGIHFHTYDWDDIDAMRVQRVDYVPAYDRIADDDPTATLLPWSDEERDALGLPTNE